MRHLTDILSYRFGSLNMIPDVTPNGVFYLPPTGWLTSFYNPSGNISQSIFDKIKKTKKLKQLRIKLLLIGISIDFILWGSVLYFLFYQGNLIWLLLGILITVALTWYITINYYHHTCYICPHCSHQFKVSFSNWLFARHTPNTRYLTCNKCHQKNYCIEEYY